MAETAGATGEAHTTARIREQAWRRAASGPRVSTSCPVQPALHAVPPIELAAILLDSGFRIGADASMDLGTRKLEETTDEIAVRVECFLNGLATALIGVRGTFSISLMSRCRRRRSWCSQPFLFPGGTATAVDLARTTEKSFRGRSFRRRHLLFNHSPHLALDPRRRYLGFALRAVANRVVRGAAPIFESRLTRSCPTHPRPRPRSQRLLISLATYNEAGNLRPLVEAIRQFAPTCSILVIDDNSPDGTGQIADELRDILSDVHVIHRAGKLGLGTATLEAMRFAIEHKFDYLLNLDADFSHPPRFIPALLEGWQTTT